MSTLFITIVFGASIIALCILLTLRIRDLRSGKLVESDIPHYDSSLFVSVLLFIKRESVVYLKRGFQNMLIFLVKLWILVLHKTKALVRKYLPMIKSRKHIWESTGTIMFHNFNEYRAKIRRYKRKVEKEHAMKEIEELEKKASVEEVDENKDLV